MMELVDIVGICFSTKNKHFIWFGKLIVNHIDEIITHAKYKISSGKIEEINNKIKTLRRQAYGYPDNEYFFLKLFDITRNQIISHKNNDWIVFFLHSFYINTKVNLNQLHFLYAIDDLSI